MWPGRLNFILLLYTSFAKLEVGLFEVWQWSEDILLDHSHHVVKVWDDKRNHSFLILQ